MRPSTFANALLQYNLISNHIPQQWKSPKHHVSYDGFALSSIRIPQLQPDGLRRDVQRPVWAFERRCSALRASIQIDAPACGDLCNQGTVVRKQRLCREENSLQPQMCQIESPISEQDAEIINRGGISKKERRPVAFN